MSEENTEHPHVQDITNARNDQRSELGNALAAAFAKEDSQEQVDLNDATGGDYVPDEEEQPEAEGEEGSLEEAENAESGDIDYADIPAAAKERAEFLGVEPEFFYDVEYTMQDGSTMTAGDMKNALQNGDTKQVGIQQSEMLRQQQAMQAHAALDQEFGTPLRQKKDMLQQIENRYREINWKAQVDEHGDQAEMARMKMQMEYSQLQNQIAKDESEYGTKMQEYGNTIAQAEYQEIVKTHPTWSDGNVAQAELKSLHEAIAGTGLSYDMMMSEIGQPGGAMKLAILEMAAKGVQAGSINKNKVKRKMQNIKSGRTISRKQQERMQAAKRMKDAKGGTRRERVAASVDMIRSAGI